MEKKHWVYYYTCNIPTKYLITQYWQYRTWLSNDYELPLLCSHRVLLYKHTGEPVWHLNYSTWNYRRCSDTSETLGAELAEQRHPSSDPVLGRHAGVQRHGDDVVGGVARGGQRAAPLAGLIDGRQVAHPLGDVLSFNGLQPHLRQRERERGGDEVTGSNDGRHVHVLN